MAATEMDGNAGGNAEKGNMLVSLLKYAAIAGAAALAVKAVTGKGGAEAAAGGGLVDKARDMLGGDTVTSVLKFGSKYGEVASFLTGFLTDNKDVAVNVKGSVQLMKGLESVLDKHKSKPQTVGDVVQAVQEYRIFKEDVEKGDSVLWASTKALVISKIEGWVAKKVAGAFFSNETPLDRANEKLRESQMEASNRAPSAPQHVTPVEKDTSRRATV